MKGTHKGGYMNEENNEKEKEIPPVYIIVTGGADELQEIVNAMLEKGYLVHGNLITTGNDLPGKAPREPWEPTTKELAQVMIKGTNILRP
jgi:hypothetical protein